MRKIKTLFFAAAAALTVTGIIFAASCKKSSTTTAQETTTTASDQAVTEKSYADAQTISEDAVAASGSSLTNYRTTGITSSGCATVTTTTSGSGDTTIKTINFGTSDCPCLDGRLRRGEIIVTYLTGSWNTVGASRTITFNNYFQNNNQITGSKTVTYTGLVSGLPTFSVSVNGTLTYPSGKTVTAVWTRTRTWLSGFTLSGGTTGTPVWSSDIVYSVSGSGSLTNSLGQSATVNIPAATPLIYALGCEWIEAGTITYTLASDGKTRSINYGNTATCDDQAVVTLANGTTVTITLP